MKIYLPFLAGFLFFSCQTAKTIDKNKTAAETEQTVQTMKNELIGKWTLDYMSPVAGKSFDKLFGIQMPYLTFVDDVKVAGNNGCNNIAGEYSVTGERISFDTEKFKSTRMYCENFDETAFTGVLKTINGYSVINEGQKLILLTGDIVSMTFVRTQE